MPGRARIILPPEPLQHGAEPRMRVRVAPRTPNCLAFRRLALHILALPLERRPEIEVALAVGGTDPERIAAHRLGLRVEPLGEQDAGQASMRGNAYGLQAHGLA